MTASVCRIKPEADTTRPCRHINAHSNSIPSSTSPWFHLGNTFVQTGQYTDAIAAFRRYLQDATSDFETRRGYRSLAVVELRRGRLTDALAFARKAGVDLPLTITEARIRIAMGEPPDRIAGLLRPPPAGPNRGSRLGERGWCNVQGLLALKRGAAG
jgi:hypothetical protein